MSAAPLKILVVDEERPIRKLLRQGLRAAGYEVLEAADGRTSLQLLSQNPNLIILELGLPDMEGMELLQKMCGGNERIPVVVLSNRGDEAGKVQALDQGPDDYVIKPFSMEELVARIRAALRHHHQVDGERADLPDWGSFGRPGSTSHPGRRQGREAFSERVSTRAATGPTRRQGADPQVPAHRAMG